MRKSILAIIAAFLFVIAVNAQDYNTGIGFRGGFSQGLTVKHFVGDQAALEGILATYRGGFAITGLYEIHANAFDTPRLNWYYGFGAHVGFWNENPWDSNENGNILGIDGILGMEYNIEDIPINISIDWKPSFNLIGYSGAWLDGGALSVRYIF